MIFSVKPTQTGLEPLSQAVEAQLKARDICPGLIAVTASEQTGKLLLLAEHSSPEMDEPNGLLHELEAVFREVVPMVGLPDADWAMVDPLPVRLYLKVDGTPDPYAIYTFTWRPEDAANVIFPATPESPEAPDLSIGEADGAAPVGDDLWPETGDRDDLGHYPETQPQNLDPLSAAALALPEVAVEPPEPNPWALRRQAWGQQSWQFVRYYWSYGLAALILLGSGSFAYAITRPCVVGGCDRIEKAANFYDMAQASLTIAPTANDLVVAHTDLQAAIDLLSPVPTWSPYYEVVQTDLRHYRASIATLDAVLQAQALASQAATLSQNPPHPVERWVNIHLLWRQAINRLESIATDSPVFDYAQHKLSEYRSNYSAIGRRIVAEEEAEANFNTALQTGDLARQRMETANSLAGWQLAAKEWQAAIKGLTLIPQGTMVYREAQAQLQDYRQQQSRAENRSTLEEAGARGYDRAVQSARQAAAYEANGQWTLAVNAWRQAVGSAQQIPVDTLLAEEGALLLETYQPALANAQGRLRSAVALQNLTTTLGEICAGSATPCTVRESPTQVQITLPSQYAEPLRQAITPPAADGTFAFTNQMSTDAQQLLEEITTTSHQIQRQIAIYDAHGGFVARYRPDLGGFVKN
jgi:tetratricopeptide (TPR) repeat protein